MKRILTAAFASLAFAAPVSAGPAWMIIRHGWGAGASGHMREFDSMEDCELAAEHISKVRTPKDGSTRLVPGAWKFNYKRRGLQHEPLVSMLCIPVDATEIEGTGETLKGKNWYRDL
jgi:hypothetical protein